ncbi:mercuric ion transport protein [Mariprofundus micogutta]|uniref:Mercuric ion transport protein n=1 Tax=Mariprofundus micogutta TaxID=1921010 RepID=A0A1L8CKL2_9PROT|nr:mercury resistance system transport protein MerF [Mariprofundus micogutta]GAV19440.1 mercuric ion transport protein [Mariprofundus micogutta]
MKSSTLLKTGITGAVLSALCCFTPVLVMLLGIVGVSAWVGYLDYVLMPALLFFLALTVFALKKKDSESKTND